MLAEVMIAASLRGNQVLRAKKDLEDVAQALVTRAQAAWPKVDVNPIEFVAHIARCIDDAEDVEAALTDIHVVDLWLAFACGQGSSVAIANLDQQLDTLVAMALARMKDKVAVDDVGQLLREKLLVGETPKILEYAGRGPLGGWMRIAAVRTALSLTRRGDGAAMQPVTREVLLQLPSESADPEMAHLRKRYASDFKRAFEEALSELTPEDRNLLRLSLVDGLSIDEIGLVFGVHRATAARHLARCREDIQNRTREILSERLAVGAAELRSIMGYIQSHLDLSIQRLLAHDGDTDSETPSAPKATKPAAREKKKKVKAKAKKK